MRSRWRRLAIASLMSRHSDPGNLPEEAHGAIVVRAASGKLIAQYDPCKTCKYSDTAWSPNGNLLAFLAADSAAGKTTLYVVENDAPREASSIDGVANTVRWSPDGKRIALLMTPGAHKKTGAIEAGAAQVGEIGVAEDEQRIAIVASSGGEPRLVSPADTYIYEFDWAPNGRALPLPVRRATATITVDRHTRLYRGRDRCPARRCRAEDDILPGLRDGKTIAFIGVL
jgi:dipeptidyl aminopeptidase/acylaminoacyl peptidase